MFNKSFLIVIVSFFITTTNYAQSKTVEKIGDVAQIALPITAFATAVILKDKKGAWQYIKSFGTTFVVTHILKETIHKERPGEHWSYDSFPSGHTSSAFSGASFIQRRYGWKYGFPAYALAAFTGYSRVHAKKHDIIDGFAGAVIGIGSTYIFTTPYQQKHYKLTFDTHEDSYLIGFTYNF